MFSMDEKRFIAAQLERILLDLRHPEMPRERASFRLHVDGKEVWSFADIEPNWKFNDQNPAKTTAWNEQARDVMKVEDVQKMRDVLASVQTDPTVNFTLPDMRGVYLGTIPPRGPDVDISYPTKGEGPGPMEPERDAPGGFQP